MQLRIRERLNPMKIEFAPPLTKLAKLPPRCNRFHILRSPLLSCRTCSDGIGVSIRTCLHNRVCPSIGKVQNREHINLPITIEQIVESCLTAQEDPSASTKTERLKPTLKSNTCACSMFCLLYRFCPRRISDISVFKRQ